MIKNAKRYVFNPLTILLSITLFFFLNFKSTSEESMDTSKFSDEEFFKGVFFGEGEIGKKIPEFDRIKKQFGINSFSSEQQKAVADIQKNVCSIIKKEKPKFFADFREKVETRDQKKIKEALGEASQITQKIILDRNPELGKYINSANLKGALKGVKNFDELEERIPEVLERVYVENNIAKTIDVQKMRILEQAVQSYTDISSKAGVYVIYENAVVATQAVAAAAAVAVAVVVVAVIAIMPNPMMDGGQPVLLQEQLVNSIATIMRK